MRIGVQRKSWLSYRAFLFRHPQMSCWPAVAGQFESRVLETNAEIHSLAAEECAKKSMDFHKVFDEQAGSKQQSSLYASEPGLQPIRNAGKVCRLGSELLRTRAGDFLRKKAGEQFGKEGVARPGLSRLDHLGFTTCQAVAGMEGVDPGRQQRLGLFRCNSLRAQFAYSVLPSSPFLHDWMIEMPDLPESQVPMEASSVKRKRKKKMNKHKQRKLRRRDRHRK